MTNDDRTMLEALKVLLAKATKGPWREWRGDICVTDADDGDDVVLGCVGKSLGARSSVYGIVKAHTPEGGANLSIIVAAVNALPRLIALVEQGRDAALEEAATVADNYHNWMGSADIANPFTKRGIAEAIRSLISPDSDGEEGHE